MALMASDGCLQFISRAGGPEELGPRKHPGCLRKSSSLLGECRQRLLLFGGERADLVVDAGQVDAPVVLDQPGEDLRERHGGVGQPGRPTCRCAPAASVHHLYLHRDQAPKAVVIDGRPGVRSSRYR